MFGGIRRLLARFGYLALVPLFFVGLMGVITIGFPETAFAEYEPPGEAFSASWVHFIGGMLAQFVNWLGNGVGSLTLIVIEVVVVNVLNYNNFSSSNIVTLGWTLTRDMVNMFAVIVLLILAVKTMIGQTASAWQQHLPRFFLGIVFANFSRTLCGLAVDASQIVMMTFVNALMSIAAGNFAQLMLMPQSTTYSAATFESATQSLITLGANIANAYAKLLVQVVVLAVMLLLAVAFIWRIIMLWIAFIMAPLAAFSWGSKEVVGYLGRVYQEWVAAFVPPLTLGPLLAFFLYLALAASSNGNLAKAEAFPEPENRTTYGQITLEVFESTNFTGLLLAVVFLLMGIKESAKISAKMGGLASAVFNDKTAGRVFRAGGWVTGKTVGNVAKLGTRGALKLGGAAGVGLERLGSRYGKDGLVGSTLTYAGKATGAVAGAVDDQVRLIPTNVMDMPKFAKNRAAAAAKAGGNLATKAGEELTKGISKNVGNKYVASALNALGPNALLEAGSFLSAQEHHVSEAEAKAAKERVSHMTTGEKVARLQQFLEKTGEKSPEAFADAENLRGLLLTDKTFEESFKKSVNDDAKFEEHIDKIMDELQHESDGGHLSVEKETWNKARSKYIDAYARLDAKDGKNRTGKFIDSDDFSGRLMRESAVSDATVLAALQKSSSGKTDNGRIITKLEEMNRGNYGNDKTAAGLAATVPIHAASSNTEELVRTFARGGAAHLTQANFSNPAVVESLIEGKVKSANFATEEIVREAAAAAAAGRAPAVTPDTVQREFAAQVMATQEIENITKAFDNGQFDESHISSAMFNPATNPNADRAVLSLAKAEKIDFSKMNSSTRDQINTQLQAMEGAGGRISADDAGVLRKKLLGGGKIITDIIPGINPATATIASPADGIKMQQLFRVDPSSIAQVGPAVTPAATAGAPNAFTRAIVEGLSKEDFKKLSDMFSRETSTARKATIKGAMDTINEALIAHEKEYAAHLAVLETKRTTAAATAKAAGSVSDKKDAEREMKLAEREISEYKNQDGYKQVKRARNDHKFTERYMT